MKGGLDPGEDGFLRHFLAQEQEAHHYDFGEFGKLAENGQTSRWVVEYFLDYCFWQAGDVASQVFVLDQRGQR